MRQSKRLFAAVAALGIWGGVVGCFPEQNLPDPADQATTATPETEFHNWARGDAQVDEYDFIKAVESLRLFQMWDADGDGVVDPDEFTRFAFRIWDVDDNGVIVADEWKRAAAAFHRRQQPFGKFTQWDRDSDDVLDLDELQQGFVRTSLFRYWDTDEDGRLSHTEFAQEAFAVWDTSDNGMIDQREWNRGVEEWVMRFRRAPEA